MDDIYDLKVWKVIDDVGMCGVICGGVVMNVKYLNFLINVGDVMVVDLEGLGEEVRKKVYDFSGIMLEWEIMWVG